MKRSKRVPLVVLGSLLSVAGCGDGQDLTQQRYYSKENCVKDWGEEQRCTSSSGGYYGPRYYWDRDLGRPMIVNGDGSVSAATNARIGSGGSSLGANLQAGKIARGGFGGFSRGFSAGG